MEKHNQLTDAEFEQRFKAATLDPAIFSHEAHLRLAWIHIKNYGVETAIQNITAQLQNYVAVLGEKDKYNHTLTIAAIRAVYHFMLKSGSETFVDFIKESPRLKSDFKTLIDTHYGIDIFTSPTAKQTYLEPDLLPFD